MKFDAMEMSKAHADLSQALGWGNQALENLKMQTSVLWADRNVLKKQRDTLLAALKAVEWDTIYTIATIDRFRYGEYIGTDEKTISGCPECRATKEQGHKTNCKIGKAIAACEQTPAEAKGADNGNLGSGRAKL